MSSEAQCYTPGYQQLDLSTLHFSLTALMPFLMWLPLFAPSALPPSSLFTLWAPSPLSFHFDFFSTALTFLSSIFFISASFVGRSALMSFYLFIFSLQGNTIESEHLSELTEEEYEAQIYQRQDLKGFMWLDAKYLNPFFTRRLTQEVRESEGDRNLFVSAGRLHNIAHNHLNIFNCFPGILDICCPVLQARA